MLEMMLQDFDRRCDRGLLIANYISEDGKSLRKHNLVMGLDVGAGDLRVIIPLSLRH